MSGWGLEPIMDSYGVVAALAGLLVAVLLLVAPWSRQAARGRRWTLLGLRATVIGLLLIAMLRPYYRSTQSRPQESTLLVLLDRSRSMGVEDSTDGASRWKDLTRAVEQSGSEWQRLRERFQVEAFGFAEKLDAAPFDLAKTDRSPPPQGQQTDIAGSLSEALRRQAGKRMAGVLLLSDGAQRVLQPRADMQQVVRELNRQGVPLFTIPFGKPREQSQARDVAVEQLPDSYVVYVKNEVEVQARVRLQGYVNQPVRVRAVLEGPGPGENSQVATQELTAQQDDQSLEFRFPITPAKAGNYTLRVEADRQPGELVDGNNRLTSYLQVLEGGIRILYVESNLVGPEQQVLRQSLGASPDLELDYLPIDLRQRDRWPVKLATDKQLSAYDLVLIGDVPADALGEEQLNELVRFVSSGKGLMMLGGLHTLGPGGYGRDRFQTFARMLPVSLSPLEFQEPGVDQPIRADVHVPGPLRCVPRSHFITQLAPTAAASQSAWDKLPPLLGANRFEKLPARAVRLLESPAPQNAPLLVAWQYDRGRVLVFAGDSTHRWWRYGMADLHKRFWRQCMLWLANQDEQVRRDVWIRLDRHRYQRGETLGFAAGARDEVGNPLQGVEMTAELQRDSSAPRALQLTPVESEWRGPSIELMEAGNYTLKVVTKADGKPIGSATARFQVLARDLELSEPAASPDQLQLLASLTAAAGGRSLPPEQLPELLRSLYQNPPEMVVEYESKWRFGDSALDTWPFFLLFVGLLGAEWTLRKKWGLN